MAYSAFNFPVDVVWTTVTTDTVMQAGVGYFVNGGGSLNMTLPAASNVSDVFKVVDIGGHGFVVNYNSGQSILFGSNSTTVTTGNITSTQKGNMLSIYCDVANTNFVALPGEGNFSAT